VESGGMERCVEIRPQTPPQNRASQESGMIEVMKAEISGLVLLLILGLILGYWLLRTKHD